MSPKLVLFDIDGTLLNANKELPESTREAVHELQAAGHIAAFATGRAPFAFAGLKEELNISSYVGVNGQYVVHQNEMIYKQPLHTHILEELTEFASARQHPLLHLNHEDWYANTKNHPLVKQATESLKLDTEVKYHPFFHREGDVYQTVLFCPEESESSYAESFQELDFIRWHEHAVDVMPKGGSKAYGIQQLMSNLSIPAENIYAFGDGLNDISMLQSVPNSIAMGNALDIVKRAAKHVTRDVHDDGIWHGLRMIGLL